MGCASTQRDNPTMNFSRLAPLAAVLACALLASACANTIRGVGQDAKDSVQAVESIAQ